MSTTRKSYPSDVTDAEWEFLLPYLSLMREDAPQREYPLRDLFNAMRYVVRTGCQWRFLPHDLPPWTAMGAGGGWGIDRDRMPRCSPRNPRHQNMNQTIAFPSILYCEKDREGN